MVGKFLFEMYRGSLHTISFHVDMLVVVVLVWCKEIHPANPLYTAAGGKRYIQPVHTAGGEKRYTLLDHTACSAKIHPACPYCLWCKEIISCASILQVVERETLFMSIHCY
jgi:hypothetical protein